MSKIVRTTLFMENKLHCAFDIFPDGSSSSSSIGLQLWEKVPENLKLKLLESSPSVVLTKKHETTDGSPALPALLHNIGPFLEICVKKNGLEEGPIKLLDVKEFESLCQELVADSESAGSNEIIVKISDLNMPKAINQTDFAMGAVGGDDDRTFIRYSQVHDGAGPIEDTHVRTLHVRQLGVDKPGLAIRRETERVLDSRDDLKINDLRYAGGRLIWDESRVQTTDSIERLSPVECSSSNPSLGDVLAVVDNRAIAPSSVILGTKSDCIENCMIHRLPSMNSIVVPKVYAATSTSEADDPNVAVHSTVHKVMLHCLKDPQLTQSSLCEDTSISAQGGRGPLPPSNNTADIGDQSTLNRIFIEFGGMDRKLLTETLMFSCAPSFDKQQTTIQLGGSQQRLCEKLADTLKLHIKKYGCPASFDTTSKILGGLDEPSARLDAIRSCLSVAYEERPTKSYPSMSSAICSVICTDQELWKAFVCLIGEAKSVIKTIEENSSCTCHVCGGSLGYVWLNHKKKNRCFECWADVERDNSQWRSKKCVIQTMWANIEHVANAEIDIRPSRSQNRDAIPASHVLAHQQNVLESQMGSREASTPDGRILALSGSAFHNAKFFADGGGSKSSVSQVGAGVVGESLSVEHFVVKETSAATDLSSLSNHYQ